MSIGAERDLLEQLLSIVAGHGSLEGRNRGAVFLGEGEGGDGGDEDLMLRVHVPYNLLPEVALQLRREGIPCSEITQHVRPRGLRPEKAARAPVLSQEG